ncbi:hypothetical protein BCC0238_004763 [Burkholderia gladioli]
MRALDNPTMPPQPFAAFDTAAGGTGLDAALPQITSATREVIPFVSVQFAQALAWLTVQAPYRWDGIERGLERHRIVSIGSRDHDGQRNAACIYDDVSFRSELAAIGRVGPGFLAPGAGDGSIKARALPIDVAVFTQPTQHRQMQSIPYAGGLPSLQTSPARYAAAEAQLLREVFPRDAGLQHIQDAVERSLVINRAPPSALGRGGGLRNQRFQRYPQFVADFASCHAAGDTTSAASCPGCVSGPKSKTFQMTDRFITRPYFRSMAPAPTVCTRSRARS